MKRLNPPHIFTFILLVTALTIASLLLLSPNWHPVKGADAGPSPIPNSITVTSKDIGNGTALTGFTVDLRVNGNPVQSGFTPVTFSGLKTGVQYQVVVYWYGNYYFRDFSDGDLNRYALVTLNASQDSVSLTGLYQYVPAAQAASLNILAQFPNGTQIGTTFNNTDYIQHTPGMWLTVTPPGSSQPFTGSFTGGSILPFILFRGQTYTVQMTAGYGNIQFLHWKDNNSTDLTRQVRLNGEASYTAIYDVMASKTTSTASTSTSTSTMVSTSAVTKTSTLTNDSTVTKASTNTSQTSSPSRDFPLVPSLAFAAGLIAVIVLLSQWSRGASRRVEGDGSLSSSRATASRWPKDLARLIAHRAGLRAVGIAASLRSRG